jgi:AcrR family transcriptional regulator
MRRLATELGVEAMSLYNHVANKEDLHRGLVDGVWSEVDLALDDPDWRSALRRLCGSSFRAMVAHPWFLSLPVTYGGVHRLHVINATLGHLKGAGAGAGAAFHSLHALDGYVAGYAWQAIGYADLDLTGESGAEILAVIDADAWPHLWEHARMHVEAEPEGDGFVIGLDMLLDGVERAGKT